MSFLILRGILATPDINAQQKLVLIAMNQYGKDGDNIYPSIDTIAKLCSLSPRQTRRHIKTLRLQGYLKPHGKGRNNTIRYSLIVPTSRPSKVVPEGRERPTNNLYTTLDNPSIRRDSNFNYRNKQAIPIDRFSTTLAKDSVDPEPTWKASVRVQNRKR